MRGTSTFEVPRIKKEKQWLDASARIESMHRVAPLHIDSIEHLIRRINRHSRIQEYPRTSRTLRTSTLTQRTGRHRGGSHHHRGGRRVPPCYASSQVWRRRRAASRGSRALPPPPLPLDLAEKRASALPAASPPDGSDKGLGGTAAVGPLLDPSTAVGERERERWARAGEREGSTREIGDQGRDLALLPALSARDQEWLAWLGFYGCQ